ncbi:MAG: GNAT family N-acetyltransferase, partial [SAR324 cluster bacterium]|nr:GNAT family N-acetyltransferase [SAR324 cluster bacterium]
MYNRPIVKDDFEVPEELVTKNFILRPLTINYLDRDYEAVMESEKHLYKLMDDSDWPKKMTLNENLVDLGWHEREFSLRHSFA